jgi:hypothetical protein
MTIWIPDGECEALKQSSLKHVYEARYRANRYMLRRGRCKADHLPDIVDT